MLYACAALGSSIESFALEVRHLQRTEVSEVQEPFAAGAQKGSSAMPHKRNPWRSEQLCGLARVLRGNLQAGLENVALWHERDMSHSSVERIVLTDSLVLAYYMTERFPASSKGSIVHTDRMRENLDVVATASCSAKPVLLALVESGLARDDAYRIVQRAATRTWEERRPFRAVLGDDADVTAHLSRRAPRRVLRPQHVGRARGSRRRRARGRDAVSNVALPHHYTGKVRELYEVGHDRMLVVASDRISVFDVVLDDKIPDKGRVLTALSTFWFERDRGDLAPEPPGVVRPHRLPRDRGPRRRGPGDARPRRPPGAAGVRRRGYLFGVGVEATTRTPGRCRAVRSRPACAQAERLPAPIFTPTTKAEQGHDLPLTDVDAAELVGDDVFEQLRDLTLRGLRVRRRSTPTRGA